MIEAGREQGAHVPGEETALVQRWRAYSDVNQHPLQC